MTVPECVSKVKILNMLIPMQGLADVRETRLRFPAQMSQLMLDVERSVDRQMELDADEARYNVTEGIGMPISRSDLIYDSEEGDNVTYYAKVASDGSVYTSALVHGESWTPYVYLKNGQFGSDREIVKVLHFVHSERTNQMRAVCRKVRVDQNTRFCTPFHTEITHIVAFEDVNEFFSCDINNLEDRLYKVKNYLSEMPNALIRGYYHNDAA